MYTEEPKQFDQPLVVSQRPGFGALIVGLPGALITIWTGLVTMNVIAGFYEDCTCADGTFITHSPTIGNYLFGGFMLLMGLMGLKYLTSMLWSKSFTVQRSGLFTLTVKFVGRTLHFEGSGADISHVAIVERDTGEGMTYLLRLHFCNGHKFDIDHGGSLESIQALANAVAQWLGIEATAPALDDESVDQSYSALNKWMSDTRYTDRQTLREVC